MWQPIETAPKETPVLCYFTTAIELPTDAAEGCIAVMALTDEGGIYSEKHWRGYYSGIGPSYDNPTHWMPLPKPPIDHLKVVTYGGEAA